MSTFIYFSLKEALNPKRETASTYTLSSGNSVATPFCSDEFLSESKARKTFGVDDLIFVGKSYDKGPEQLISNIYPGDRFSARVVYQSYLNQVEESGKDITVHLSGTIPLEYNCLLNSMVFQHQEMFSSISKLKTEINSIERLFNQSNPVYVQYPLFTGRVDLRDIFMSISYKSPKNAFEMLRPCFEDWGFVKSKVDEIKEVEEVKLNPETLGANELKAAYEESVRKIKGKYVKNNPYAKYIGDGIFAPNYQSENSLVELDVSQYTEMLKNIKIKPDFF